MRVVIINGRENLPNKNIAFQDDLELLGADQRVLSMTFSEFGRRPASNASLGTDHGTAAPMFLFGRMVRPGIVGLNPSLTDLTAGNLKTQFDFRQVYASLLAGWFGLSAAEVESILLRPFQPLDLVQTLRV